MNTTNVMELKVEQKIYDMIVDTLVYEMCAITDGKCVEKTRSHLHKLDTLVIDGEWLGYIKDRILTEMYGNMWGGRKTGANDILKMCDELVVKNPNKVWKNQ